MAKQKLVLKKNVNRYIIGSGVGPVSNSNRRALIRRASNNSQNKPCCIPVNNIKK